LTDGRVVRLRPKQQSSGGSIPPVQPACAVWAKRTPWNHAPVVAHGLRLPPLPRRRATLERSWASLVGLETSAIPAVPSHGIRLHRLLHGLRQPLCACRLRPARALLRFSTLDLIDRTLGHPVAAACRWTRRTDNGLPNSQPVFAPVPLLFPIEPSLIRPSRPDLAPGTRLPMLHPSLSLASYARLSRL
jgi:hypothetical protein